MNDKASYPQIPSTVWWGVRNILQRTPNVTIDDRTLGIELNVQEVAARQYISELRRVGVLNEEFKATPLALRWRLEETYGEAVDEFLTSNYPEGLTQIAPRGAADRQKVISWFTREGLGSGTAGNKAATYLLISSEAPNEPPVRGGSGSQKSMSKQTPVSKASSTKGFSSQSAPPVRRANGDLSVSAAPPTIPLNINVQIHISAEASGEQIESIFSAMRRYLYDSNS